MAQKKPAPTRAEEDLAFKLSRLAHWLMDDPGFTRRSAAPQLAEIARQLSPDLASKVPDRRRHRRQGARTWCVREASVKTEANRLKVLAIFTRNAREALGGYCAIATRTDVVDALRSLGEIADQLDAAADELASDSGAEAEPSDSELLEWAFAHDAVWYRATKTLEWTNYGTMKWETIVADNWREALTKAMADSRAKVTA